MADRDQYGKFIKCMQCGLTRDLPNTEGGNLLISAKSMPVPVALTSEGPELKRISRGGRHCSKTVVFDPDELSDSAA